MRGNPRLGGAVEKVLGELRGHVQLANRQVVTDALAALRSGHGVLTAVLDLEDRAVVLFGLRLVGLDAQRSDNRVELCYRRAHRVIGSGHNVCE